MTSACLLYWTSRWMGKWVGESHIEQCLALAGTRAAGRNGETVNTKITSQANTGYFHYSKNLGITNGNCNNECM